MRSTPLVLAAVLNLAGCGDASFEASVGEVNVGGVTVHSSSPTERVERELTDGFQGNFGTALASVECPEIEPDTTATYQCDAVAEGVSFTYRVNVTPSGFDSAPLGVVVRGRAERIIEAQVAESAQVSVEAECAAPAIREAVVGDALPCRLTEPNGAVTMAEIRVTGADGAFDWSTTGAP